MDHSKFESLIQKHIDNALSPLEEERLAQHLAECPDCAALLRDLTRLDDLLAAELTEVEPPAGFAASVMSALPAAEPKRRRPFYLLWGSVAAAILLLLAGISGFFHQGDTLAPPPEVATDEEEAERPELFLPNAPQVADNDAAADEKEDAASTDEEKENKEDKQDAKPEANQQPAGDENELDQPAPTYSGEHELPTVASRSYASGAYSMVTLASVANCDALRPQVYGSVVNFYVNLDGSYLQWQVNADGSGNAVFLGECGGLPGLPGVGQYHCDEAGREWYSASYGSYTAENTDSGLLLNGETVAPGGGYLLSWAGDGNKFFFSDGSGRLYLYYPAEGMLLDVGAYASSAEWYGVNNIVLAAYDSATGYDSIFRISVP